MATENDICQTVAEQAPSRGNRANGRVFNSDEVGLFLEYRVNVVGECSDEQKKFIENLAFTNIRNRAIGVTKEPLKFKDLFSFPELKGIEFESCYKTINEDPKAWTLIVYTIFVHKRRR